MQFLIALRQRALTRAIKPAHHRPSLQRQSHSVHRVPAQTHMSRDVELANLVMAFTVGAGIGLWIKKNYKVSLPVIPIGRLLITSTNNNVGQDHPARGKQEF